MMDSNLLLLHGAKLIEVQKNETIFNELDKAKYYFQIIQGCVKMVNYKEDGKQFMQGYFTAGQSFGEPPLFINKPYPATAVAITNVQLIRMCKEKLFLLLETQPQLNQHFLKLLSQRIYSKSTTNKFLTQAHPELRVKTFLQQFKESESAGNKNEDQFLICLTRQEIADFTGLRVETVIRALKKMEKENVVEIRDRRLYV